MHMTQYMILIDGPMGSGKTTTGKILHKKLKRTAMLSTDAIKWSVSDFKRDKEDNAIKHGMNILVPQAFWKKENIEPYLEIAKTNKMKVFVYQLIAPKEVLLERLKSRPKPPQAKTPVSKTKIMKNLKMWEENQYNLGKIFDTSILSTEKIAKAILIDIKF